ncbi:MAG: 6-phosphogluconolactonase [Chloroflexota bacterium]
MTVPQIPVFTYTFERLRAEVYATRDALGQAAAAAVATRMRAILAQQPRVRMIFAAAPSQNEFLAALSRMPDLEWARVEAFHMDEYVGLAGGAPASFACFLRERLFGLVQPGRVEYLNGAAPDAQAECERYAALLAERPVDIVCAGIGENGHMAFNDPHVADFADLEMVKLVAMDEVCRMQQVHDGAFPALAAVPTTALTLTIPALIAARYLYCMVPGPTKTAAVRRTCHEAIAEACPATLLRRHAQAVLYLVGASAAAL